MGKPRSGKFTPSPLGAAITYYRSQRGLSQRDLADRAGLAHPHLCRIETGALQNPSWDVVVRLAQGIPVSLDALVRAQPPRADQEARYGDA